MSERQPAQRFRIGSVTAAIWKSDAGFFNVTLTRSYKDGNDWKSTDNLNHGDLLNGARVLQRAEDWISKQ